MGGSNTWSGVERSPTELGKRSRAALARIRPKRRSMERPSHHHQRHPLEAAHRLALSRSPGEIWSLADLLRPFQSLETRRHLGSPSGPRADQKRCGGRSAVGSERGRHGDPGSPARSRRQGRVERGGHKKGLLNPEDEALGRSRGGFSTKLHLACNGKGRPLSAVLTAGQRHGSAQLEELLDAVRIPRPKHSPGSRASAPPTCSPTGATASRGAGSCCTDGASSTPSPNARTRKSVARGVRAPTWFRPGGLPQAQRGREARKQTQAVARYSNPL